MNLKIIIFILCVSFALFPGFSSGAWDVKDTVPSCPSPVGSGARALGMGGAFIAVADDATAASWNPGGLIQLELPEISFVHAGFHRIDDNTFNMPGASGEQSVSEIRVNYLSAVYPFKYQGHNMIVSVSCQNLYDFTQKRSIPLITAGESRSNEDFDFEVSGSLSTLGFSYCIQVIPQFSLGFTVNIWEDWLYDNEWEERRFQKGYGVDRWGYRFTRVVRNFDRYSFSGLNANFGFLWHVNSRFTIGGILKTPFKADLDHEHALKALIQYPDLGPKYDSETDNTFHEKEAVDMPISYGLGFAFRFSDAFMVSFDIYRTEWDDFVFTDHNGNEASPITGKPADISRIDPAYQARMGFEYLFIHQKYDYEVPLCAGVFYDPVPTEGSPDDFFGFSLGSGIRIGRFNFDVAYQYRFGNDTGDAVWQSWDFSQDVKEHTIYSSVIIHF
ncbi:MAG: hypothetical protein GY795_44920 [Desulfobacterales bacterium]|nr:hypothetical protein [Desulfobacterales bacterium]